MFYVKADNCLSEYFKGLKFVLSEWFKRLKNVSEKGSCQKMYGNLGSLVSPMFPHTEYGMNSLIKIL